MQTQEFFQAIFPCTGQDDPRANDLVRFVAVGAQQPWPGAIHWRTRADLHTADARDASGLGFDLAGKDVYFTPHGFTRQSMHVVKEDAVPLLDVAWVELDDADIPPDTFRPLPSIVVTTSEGRHHLYWLLKDPLPAQVVERINYRLTYGNGMKKDTGGWHLVKLLRVPGTASYKRTQPFAVNVTGYYPDRVYSEADFADLPAAPDILNPISHRAMPSEDTLVTRQEIERKFSFTRELEDLVDRARSDRSSALWRIYNICYQVGMSEEDCFALVRGTPNDKFTEWRYNGEEGLWKDILRGFHMAHSPEDTPVLKEIKMLRGTKGMPASERRRKIAVRIAQDLSERGRIYYDDAKREAMYYDGTRVIPMDPTDRRWKALLNLRYEITEGEDEYRPVNANLYALSTANGEPITPRTSSYWDRDRFLLYVYNGGGKVYRLDGVGVELVDNGTDGVLFRDTGFIEPFTAEPPDKRRNIPTLESAILGLPNYEDNFGKHSAAQATLLARIWLYSLFFAEHMDARPHLVVTGPTNAGKTLVFQALGELMSGPGMTVSTIPHDQQTFETVVSNAHHVFFDNVDTPNKWLMDALAEVATGIQFTRRVLYSTNESVTFRVQCMLGLTTRDPWFSRTDIATRLIVLHVERREMNRNPTELLDQVRRFRGNLWFELLSDLNNIVAGLKTYKGVEHNIRMAGFADFLTVVCQTLDFESEGLMDVISGTQVSSALDHAIVWTCLEPWLRKKDRDDPDKYKNNGQWVATNRLHQELRLVANEQGCQREYDRKIPSARSLSHQLRELVPDIKRVIEVDFERKQPANVYRFTLPSEESVAA